jgi:hypothetical protein
MDIIRENILPNELIEQIRRREVILFVGAGLSMNAGLPGWTDLAHFLAQDIGYHWPAPEDITTEHLLTIFQYFDNKYGRNNMVRTLRNMLQIPGVSPAAVHYLITLLPVQIIFTTNYDDLLERSYRDVMRSMHVVVNPLELAYWTQDDTQIIKLCGDLARPESIVITKSDFNIYSETHRSLIEYLRATLETRTALFVGYSLRDPFINQIWDTIHLLQGKHHRMAYAVIFNNNLLELEDFRRRGIQVIQPVIKNSVTEAFLGLTIDILKELRLQISEEKIQNVVKYIPDRIVQEIRQQFV